MQKNIVETARDAGTFTTLIAAIDRAGLESTLAGEGPFTVFAPSDEAFAQLPEGTVDSLLAEPDMLAEVLNYHLATCERSLTSPAARSARIRSARRTPSRWTGRPRWWWFGAACGRRCRRRAVTASR